MHRMIEPCSISKGSSSVAKSWSNLAFEKNDSCAAERLAKPQADSTSAGAWTLASVRMTRRRNNEQSPDW